MITEIDEYTTAVLNIADRDSEQWISNGMPEHAAVLYKVFFARAKEKIQIFCRNLKAEVFDSVDMINAAMSALERGVKVDIIVQQSPESTNGFFKALKNVSYPNLSIKILPANHPFVSLQQNFCVIDEKALRYESNASSIQALASMNRPSVAKQLSENFATIAASIGQRSPENLFVQPTI